MAQGYLEIPATQGAISDLLITLSTRRVAGGFAVRIPLLGRHRQQGGGLQADDFLQIVTKGVGIRRRIPLITFIIIIKMFADFLQKEP